MTGVGPRRLVLIRSAGYDYAEIEFDEAVHLVAPNNAGKTSLIASLQFLFIDQLNRMHFAHPSTETRRHYFPESNSFVLFECDTPSGLQVLAVRGLGPARGYEFERLTYRGAYSREHFVEDGHVRSWEEIRPRLAELDLDVLGAQQLSSSLVGTAVQGRAPLHIVPLRRSSSYRSFRILFRNLLRLSRLDQDDLKDLFVDGAGIGRRARTVDLRSDFADLYDRVTRHLDEIEELRRVKPLLDGLVDAFDARTRLRRALVGLWRTLEASLAAERAGLESAVAGSRERAALQREVAARADEEFSEVGSEIRSLASAEGGVIGFLSRLDGQRDEFADYPPELEAQALSELQRRRDAVAARISQSQTGNRGALERRLRSLETAIKQDRALVERFSEAVVTWLRASSSLDERQLEDVFRVLNPSLLRAFVSQGAVEIENSATLDELLLDVAGSFEDGEFAAAGVRIRSEALSGESPLARYENLETVRARVADTGAEIEELQRRLEDLDRVEDLRRQSAEFDAELDARRGRRERYRLWQRDEQSREDKTTELERHRAALEERKRTQEAARARAEAARRTVAEAEREERAARQRLARIGERTAQLTPPPPDWPVDDEGDGEAEGSGAPLDERLTIYEQTRDRERNAHRRFEASAREVEIKTAGRYRRSTEDETIQTLRDELAALPDHEANVQGLWSAVVEGVKSRFNGLLDGVDALGDHIRKLNRALALRKVSNLERVEVRLVRQDDLIGRLRAVVDLDEMPLLGAAGGRTRAYTDVQKWLEDRPELDVRQLFGIRFRIVDRTGREKTFESLSQIESQGTSTTIKVLVHLELLKMLLRADVPITMPFFLDEVATLDDANLSALVAHATSLGFVPVVASPEPRDCVERLYFLMPGDGGLVLDETSRVTLSHVNDDAA